MYGSNERVFEEFSFYVFILMLYFSSLTPIIYKMVIHTVKSFQQMLQDF